MKYKFIAIEGNIGAGKTTLAELLAKHLQAELLLEQFADNPFLPLFYQDKQQHALPVELSFLSDRYEQLQKISRSHNWNSKILIADYSIFKSPLFARNNLNEIEFNLYKRIHDLIKATLPKPDLIIYLHTPVERLQKQIRERGRPYEQNIPAQYLDDLQRAYQNHFDENEEPLLWIDNSHLDFNNPTDFNRLIQYLESDKTIPERFQ